MMDKNEMTERILNLTLEIIYLLTGEDCKVLKTSGELITHTGMSHTRERPRIAQSIHPATGEVSTEQDDIVVSLSMDQPDCMEPPRDLPKNKVLEYPQPLGLLDILESGHTDKSFQSCASSHDCSTKDEDDVDGSVSAVPTVYSITGRVKPASTEEVSDYEGTLHYPSTPIKEESFSCNNGNLTETEIYMPTNHTTIKKESVTRCERDPTETETYISRDNTQYTNDIKEESMSGEEDVYRPAHHHRSVYRRDDSVLVEELSVTDGAIYPCTGHIDTVLHEGSFMDPDYYIPTDHTQQSSSSIKKISALCEERKLYSRTEQVQTQYTPPNFENHVLDSTNTLVKNTSLFLTCSDYATNFSNMSDSINPQTHIVNVNLKQEIHEENKSTCLQCGKCFKRKEQLKMHERIHTGEKPYSCCECGKCFTRRTQLVIHQKNHRGEKPYACSECDKFFTSNFNLVIHLRTHTGEKPYSCSYCGKGFTRKSQLKIHQRIHTGEKPYSCLECGKCFTQNAQLATHQVIHTGEKSFACTYCGKRFTTNSNRLRHQLTHVREKYFSCPECQKSFGQKSSLDSHMRLHRAEKTLEFC